MNRRNVLFNGRPLALFGRDLQVGSLAPAFSVVDANLNTVELSDFSGVPKIISSTPSLDTAVCDLQLRRFNQEISSLSGDIVALNISMDLPFAIGRFCSTAGVDRVHTLSDHREASFGTAYGVLIDDLRLLARAVFVLDKFNVIRYQEIVHDLSRHPDYERALEELIAVSGATRAA